MSLPVELLRVAENHPCFSGCFGVGDELLCLVDPSAPPERALFTQCQDCLSFRVGGLTSQLGTGMTTYKLADEVTAHVRAKRGYALSFGGYHCQSGGFWLSAAYWDTIGVFVLHGDRGRSTSSSSDVDLLVRAFASGVACPPDPGMLDPHEYTSQRAFLRVVPTPALTSAQALLASPAVSSSRKAGYIEVTIAEYLPVSRSGAAKQPPPPQPSPAQVLPAAGSPGLGSTGAGSPPTPALPLPASARKLQLGDRCEVCGEIVKERPLLTSVYIGCRCG